MEGACPSIFLFYRSFFSIYIGAPSELSFLSRDIHLSLFLISRALDIVFLRAEKYVSLHDLVSYVSLFSPPR